MSLLALGGRPQPLSEKMDSIKLHDTKYSGTYLQNLQREEGVFVIVCYICGGVDEKKTCKKRSPTKLHKIKVCIKAYHGKRGKFCHQVWSF